MHTKNTYDKMKRSRVQLLIRSWSSGYY